MKPFLCPECGCPCAATQCDDGIGPYEFQGAKGWDSKPYAGSDCCGAVLDGAELDYDGYTDYLYDCAKDDRLIEEHNQ